VEIMETAPADGSPDVQLIAARLPNVRVESIVPLGEGADHVAYLVDERLVVRFSKEPDAILRAARVRREARVLAVVAAISPLPVPEPALVAADEGCLAYFKLPGILVLDLPQEQRSVHARAIATDLGRLLRALHAVTSERMAGLVDRDDFTPEQWLDQAAEHYAAVAAAVPSAHRGVIRAFLAARVPDAPSELVFSHNDLGIEHVLADALTRKVTGILDWTDAALVDPARDFGLLHRDLGPTALDAALAAYRPGPDAAAALQDRALFYARCALLEDLAFGLEAHRPRYVEKSLAALAWLFPT
jgi:aminoglycoside phosphotransferase (APT) family kinase protein